MGESMDNIFELASLGKYHQLAMYVPSVDISEGKMRQMGYASWLHDEADIVGEVMGVAVDCRAEMAFNYEFSNGELEFLHYYGPSWHSEDGRTRIDGSCDQPFLSHKSIYVADLEQVEKACANIGLEIVQRFETRNHTNPVLLERKQRFQEVIASTRHVFGFDLKFIKRIYD